MTVSPSDLSIESLTLLHEDPDEHRRIYEEWMTAYPGGDPIEQEYIDQAVTALIDKRRLERARSVLRSERIRTAELYFDRAQDDYVSRCKERFSERCEWAMREMTRTAAGCRWCIEFWLKLDHKLKTEGTWYGADKHVSIMLQGLSARFEELCVSELAYMTWVDCMAAQPNKPKQRDIDRILDPTIVPKGIQDRDLQVWPGNPAASRARLQAIVDRELPRLRALEELLRAQYEIPARAEARQMAVARISREEMTLMRAQKMAEQSYERAATGLRKARKARGAACPPAPRQRNEAAVAVTLPVPAPAAPSPPPPFGNEPVTGRSEHRSARPGSGRAAGLRPPSAGGPSRVVTRRPSPGLRPPSAGGPSRAVTRRPSSGLRPPSAGGPRGAEPRGDAPTLTRPSATLSRGERGKMDNDLPGGRAAW